MPKLFQKVGDWLQRQQERDYLLSSGSHELMDAGISRTDFLTAMAAPADTRDRMLSMAAAFGLSSDSIDKERWHALDIARACAQCRERAACRRWLDGVEDDTDPSEFCPNAERYAEMAIANGVQQAVRPNRKNAMNKPKPWYI